MSELQLHGFNLSVARFSPSIPVPEDEVSRRSKRDGGDGTEGVQLLFVITVLAHVILSIFIPGVQTNTFRREKNIKLTF